ncbi:MAG TPA: hypothetical protein PKW23_01510 [Dictyoglomaceae bacterium]|nr:hypothetical protein [Dictyoglomaceae bacterium]HOL38868.1 hypothetical protein [Dictyoglomaceae bacterium]HOP95395.1 hypothetical protein [Dictyoglomaceae bacterium]HPP15715.1 hypothetical protein [Dictyoglomaceae bacterium]HPU44092.1 hypothetical protein [Dictyoglomaceae bacterium]
MKQILGVILIFLCFLGVVLLNVKVSYLKNEVIRITKEIDALETEKAFLENTIQKELSFKDLEEKATKLGLCYPQNVVEIRLNSGRISQIYKERYYASSYNQK